MRRIAVMLALAALLTGCSSSDTQMKPPTAQAQAQSVQSQVAAIQNDPNIPADEKTHLINQLQGGSRMAGAKKGTP